MQLLESGGPELEGGTKLGPVLVNLSSILSFGQLGITLNGRTISDGSSIYPYRAYLEILLNYGKEAESTHPYSTKM